jgi:hypothetical protein
MQRQWPSRALPSAVAYLSPSADSEPEPASRGDRGSSSSATPVAVQVGQPLDPAGGERLPLLDFVSTEQAMPVMRNVMWAPCVFWGAGQRGF